MAKHRPYSRRVLRQLRREWLRRNRRLVVTSCLVVGALLVSTAAWPLAFAVDSRLAWYVVGLTHAALLALCVHGFHTGFLLTDPDGIRHLRGAYGEENTTDVLKTAKRRRLIWCWVDSIDLDRGDIDHVVVTRRGGVLAIDSKWRNQTTANDTQEMAAAATKVRRRAEAVTQSLLKSDRGARHRARVGSVRVRPVVVIWGAEQHRLPGGVAQVEGIDFVAGRHLRIWLRQLDGDVVSEEAAAQLGARLLDFRETSGAGRHSSQAARPSVRQATKLDDPVGASCQGRPRGNDRES